jgi:LacI family transcriptional regulator
MAGMRATVKEIARRAGVSIGTVDRVLHHRKDVSAKTKARVEAIIRSLGYQPNVLARHLALNRHYVVRVLLPRSDQDSGYWRICRAGIEAGMAALGAYDASLHIDEFDRYDLPAFRTLLEGIVTDPGDGLLVAPVLPEEFLPALARLDSSVPYVFFDAALPGARPFASVGQDAAQAGHLAGRVMSLLAPGARHLAAINPHAETRHVGQRIDGFRSYFATASATATPAIEVVDGSGLDDPGTCNRILSGLLSATPGLTGILVPSASGHVVGEWLARSGKKAGCALVSWDLVPANEACLRAGSIDCIISQNPFEQGRLGLDRLLRKVVRDRVEPGRVDLPIQLWFKENLPADGANERMPADGALAG